MPIPTPPMDRRRRPSRERTPSRSASARSCKWSSSAKRVLDPGDALCAFDRDDVEAQPQAAPGRLSRQEKSHGTDDLALLTLSDGAGCSPEVDAAALAYLDHRQHLAVETHEIEFPGSASKIARQHDEPLRLQMLGRPLLGGPAAFPGIRHPPKREPGIALVSRRLPARSSRNSGQLR